MPFILSRDEMRNRIHIQVDRDNISDLRRLCSFTADSMAAYRTDLAEFEAGESARALQVWRRGLQAVEEMRVRAANNLQNMESVINEAKREIKRLEYEAAVKAGPWC